MKKEAIMTIQFQEKIRKAVRERYGDIAQRTSSGCGCSTIQSCCGNPDKSLEKMTRDLGYSSADLAGVLKETNMGLGCGNPHVIASLKAGETVLDLGSGGGFDCFLAAKQVGPAGRVIGVDMTPEMVSKARENAARMASENVEFRLGEIEHLPASDGSIDIIMSNCVINLSPDKEGVYREAFRVLKPGGRLAISDVLATTTVPAEVQKNLELISACVGGAETIENVRKILREVGFEQINIDAKKESRQFIQEWVPGLKLEDYIVSADITAVKPANTVKGE